MFLRLLQLKNAKCAKARHIDLALYFAGCILLATSLSALAWDNPREERMIEYELKAAFLTKLPQFVEWPPSAFQSKTEPFRLGLLSNDPLNASIIKSIENQTCGGRGFKVVHASDLAALKDCHIVFVNSKAESMLPKILETIGNHPILTIGDGEGFAQKGLIINFKKNPENKLRFEYNLAAAKNANLKISAKFLQVSTPALPNRENAP
jgi:hypothetical protein